MRSLHTRIVRLERRFRASLPVTALLIVAKDGADRERQIAAMGRTFHDHRGPILNVTTGMPT